MKRSITRSRAGHVGWTSNPEEPEGRAAAIPAIFRFAIVALILANTALEASAQCDKGKQQQAIAALGSQVRIQLNNHHVPSWIVGPLGARISADPVQSAIAAIKARSDVFCASVDDTFVFRGRMENDKHGQTHVRITQRYHGLDVFGLELIVHMTQDAIVGINGHFVPGINVPTEPSVTKQEASRVTLEHIAAIGGTAAIVKEIRTPVVFVDGDDKAYLAYPVLTVYTYKGNPHSDDVFIDAIAGVVVGSHPLVMTGRDREIYDGSAGGYACGSAPVHPYVPLPGAPLLAAFARGGRRVDLHGLRGGPPALLNNLNLDADVIRLYVGRLILRVRPFGVV